MVRDALAWLVGHPVVAHCLVASILMAVLGPLLGWLEVRGFGLHAAAYTSVYFYAREAAQAERALKPTLGDPLAFYWTIWPGNWSAGGNLYEWLAPTAVALLWGLTVPIDPTRGRPKVPPPARP